MKKKILLSFMFVCICTFAIGILSASAATSGTCGNNIKWEFNAETLTISGTGEMYNYSMATEQPWYDNYFSIKKIVIKAGVTSIGNYAFSGFTNLTDVTIPDSVTCIGEHAFRWNRKMTNIKLPDSVDNIKEGAFQETGLTTITIPNRITTIVEDMFYGSKLENIEIPINVTSIEKSAFSWCQDLESVIIKGNVTSIGLYGFNNCRKLTSITLPDSLITIGEMAFNYCICLEQINIPGSVTNISNNAFLDCSSLIKITVDDNNTSYYSEDGVLYSKDKTKLIRYPAGKENVKFEIPDGILEICDDAFRYCSNLTSITIPSSVKSIGTYAFCGCSGLTSVTISSGVTSISNGAFSSCSNLTSIAIPSSVTSIGTYVFKGCSSLTNIVIPEGVTSIRGYTFSDCSSLTSVTIPDGVTDIGTHAFSGCDNLTTTYYNGTEEQWSKIRIDTSNTQLTQNIIYFAYINLLDKDGNEISSKMQNMGETVDVSAITVPKGYALTLYRDKDLTQEYSLDTPISENLTLYADIIEINKLKISGAEKADIGQQGVTYSVSFATDKSAAYLNAAIEYPETLILKNIESTDFDINSETIDGITYLYCTYKSGNMPTNKTLHAFDLIFDISESAKPNDTLTIKFAGDDTYLAGSDGNTYDFDELGSTQVKINPILVKSISISGEDEIDKATKYTAVILPENATNKEIEWTADNDGIASISADGVLTPIKSGTVKITATAKDGSGVFAEKSVNVKVYARISSLASNIGVWDKDFAAGETEYVIYVPKDAKSIKLTATHSGTLTSGTKTLFSGKQVVFSLSGDETVISMTYTATGYTDGTYTVKVKKFEGTRTNVSSDGKSFEIKPTNIASGNTVILALYDGEDLIETKYEVYGGADISFTTDKAYTGAAVMVWDDLDSMKPVCEEEVVK